MDLRAYMAKYDMLPHGGTVLCAVSGGRDSVCLLHYLYTLSQTLDFTVAAAHLNHLMRPTAQRDVDFVTDFCTARGIPLYVGAAPVYELAHTWKLSVEEAGRRARYEFFERTADAVGAVRIATAHHQNDQTETVLLNLFRGTGAEGLGGIPPVRGRYIRPLLHTPRREIERYLTENGLHHIEDETNADTAYARNRLRLTILPELETLHDGLQQNVCRTAQLLREENDYLDTLAQQRLSTGTQVLCAAVADAPDVLKTRMMRILVSRLPVGKKDFTFVHYRSLAELAQKRGTLSLPCGVRAVSDGHTLSLHMLSLPEAITLHYGETRFGAYTILVSRWQEKQERSAEAFYLACAPEQITVAVCRAGERLRLEGARGARTVKRLAVERGITPTLRDTLPALYVGGELTAVYGIGQSAQCGALTQIMIQQQ